jgi:hypothetical protein
MKNRKYALASLAVLALVALAATAWSTLAAPQEEDLAASTLIATVRQATEPYQNIDAAQEVGYGLFHGCVSSATEGSMGIHLVNGSLVGDGMLDPMQPEAVLYEYRNGSFRLTGVEFVTIAEAWHANNEAPPMLNGQVFNFVGSPNRYGLPAFYELHVWSWKRNPLGTFADFNPRVRCDQYYDGVLDPSAMD